MREFNDLHSKVVFMCLKESLEPVITNLCPGFSLKNMVVNRRPSIDPLNELSLIHISSPRDA